MCACSEIDHCAERAISTTELARARSTPTRVACAQRTASRKTRWPRACLMCGHDQPAFFRVRDFVYGLSGSAAHADVARDEQYVRGPDRPDRRQQDRSV